MKSDKFISFDDALQDPAYEHLWETIRFLENAKDEDLFPEKHLLALKDLVHQKVIALNEKHPAMPLKDVVVTVLQNLAEDTPAKTVLELTKFVIEKWEMLSTANAPIPA